MSQHGKQFSSPRESVKSKFLSFDGYSEKQATLMADWLKGRDCWQAACDAD